MKGFKGKSGFFDPSQVSPPPMLEYFLRLSVLNPPAGRGEKREGNFTKLAHAREEMPLPLKKKKKSLLKKKDKGH